MYRELKNNTDSIHRPIRDSDIKWWWILGIGLGGLICGLVTLLYRI